MMAGEGDLLPVSALPVDGTCPTGTTKWEKRNIAQEIPVWDENICIQCGKCVLVCPHAVIRGKVYDPAALAGAPATFKSTAARWQGRKDEKLHAPGRAGGLHRLRALRRGLPGQEQVARCGTRRSTWSRRRRCASAERANWDFFLKLPDAGPAGGAPRQRQGRAVPGAAVRVLRGLRRLRRDAVHQAADASSSATAR